MNRKCQQCGRMVKGRTDKKFCSDRCRNHYHNQRERSLPGAKRYVYRRLRDNYHILESCLPSDRQCVRLPFSGFIQKGFDPAFHTHFIWSTSHDCFVCCFDIAFRIIPGHMIEITRTNGLHIP